jgi:hypothetical protein
MADRWFNGALRDPSGALVVVLLANAVAPLKYKQGYLRDANDALVIKSGA